MTTYTVKYAPLDFKHVLGAYDVLADGRPTMEFIYAMVDGTFRANGTRTKFESIGAALESIVASLSPMRPHQ